MILLIPVFLQRQKLKYNSLRDDAIILIPAFVFVGFYSWVFDWYFPLIFTAVGVGGYMALKPLIKSVITQFLHIIFTAI